MNLREYLRTRRQRKAHKRYEKDKARQEAARDPKMMERVRDYLGGGG